MQYNDSLTNLISGMGGSKDKQAHTRFTFSADTVEQLESAYRSDWVSAKAVDTPVNDSLRNWRSWQASADQIEAIEAEEKRIGLLEKIKEAVVASRLYGGAVIVIGVSGQPWHEPLNLNRVGRSGLSFLSVLPRHKISNGRLNDDPLSPNYGLPENYQLSSQSSGLVTIHPSRIARFFGRKLPDPLLSADGFGDSILSSAMDAIKQYGAAAANVAQLTHEATIRVIKSPGLLERVGNKEYRDKMLARYQLAMVGKSVSNTLMLDAAEEYQKISETFTGIPALLDTMSKAVSASVDIPSSKMMGEIPGGLNATGEGDLKNYYDSIKAIQSQIITPAIQLLDEVLIRSALGNRPLEIYYNWAPLWQMSEAQKADIMSTKSTAIKTLWETGLVQEGELSKATVNMIIEDGSLPGLDGSASVEEREEDEKDDETIL